MKARINCATICLLAAAGLAGGCGLQRLGFAAHMDSVDTY